MYIYTQNSAKSNIKYTQTEKATKNKKQQRKSLHEEER